VLGKGGQALLFDAMIFLTVAAFVSISLLAAGHYHVYEGENELQDFVERAHVALLRSTVGIESGNNSQIPVFMTVSDLAVSYFVTMSNGKPLNDFEDPIQEIEYAIDGMMPSWAKFRWVVVCEVGELVLGDAVSQPEYKCISTIHIGMPVIGGDLVLSLEIWS
jgi:hypothetical protein